jgi:adenylate cyclase
MKWFFILLLIFLPEWVSAQAHPGKIRVDSLLALVPAAKDDTSKVNLLNKVSDALYLAYPDSALVYANKALSLAKKAGWKRGVGMAYNSTGNCFVRKAAFPQAFESYYHALHVFEELGDLDYSGVVSGNIGTVYFDQKEYNKALEYFSKSLSSAHASNNKTGEFQAYGNIGNVYYIQSRYTDALTTMQQALAIATELGETRGILNQMTSIGNVYSAMGKNKEAIAWYSKSLAGAKSYGDQQMVAANEGNIGETYLDIAKGSTTNPAEKASYILEAINYLQLGILAARQVSYNIAVLDFLQTLSEAYTLSNNYKGALTAYQQYTSLKDSTFNIENSLKIANLETARKLALKDKDIQISRLALAKKRNERWGFIAGIVLLLGIVGILFRNYHQEKNSNHLLSKEKKRSDDLLLNILPSEVAEELKQTGVAEAKQFDEVSVLFTDFVNFTGLSEKLSPTQIVEELNECFTAFDAIIEKNGLEKIKTIGDAYMAVCGLPVRSALHAKKAVKAALEIRDFIGARKQERHAFEIRIGINSGPVVAGIVGVKKFAYDIWGDTVNTAARMEQHGEPGNINISHATYELIKDDYPCINRGKIAAKNKGYIEMYFVDVNLAQDTPAATA